MSVISYIALGSNLNNPTKQLQHAISLIEKIPQTKLIAQSTLHYSQPLGPPDQPNYINQVIAVETTLSAHALLYALQNIENKMGRVRAMRWGARVIDCDILLYGDQIIQSPDLIIPHPEMQKRVFVLYPLAEIAPDLVLPSGEPIQQCIECLI